MNYTIQFLIKPSFIINIECANDFVAADHLFKEGQAAKKHGRGTTTFIGPNQNCVFSVRNTDITGVLLLSKKPPTGAPLNA